MDTPGDAIKSSILQDLMFLQSRVSTILLGNTKHLDARSLLVRDALKHITTARDLLGVGLLPHKE